MVQTEGIRYWRDMRARYNLIGRRCGKCSRVYFPARSICLDCHRHSIGKMDPYKLQGRGTVSTFTIVHDGDPRFGVQVPYILALIQMEEGPRMTAQLVDIDPPQVTIGMRVHTVFRKIGTVHTEGVIHYGYKFAPDSMPHLRA